MPNIINLNKNDTNHKVELAFTKSFEKTIHQGLENVIK